MIDIRTLDDIALLAESAVLECKLAGGRDGRGKLPGDFWESYSALANTDGGIILAGSRQTGSSFGAVYHISDTEDVFNSPNLTVSSLNLDYSSPNLKRDEFGRHISASHTLLVVRLWKVKIKFNEDEQEQSSCSGAWNDNFC